MRARESYDDSAPRSLGNLGTLRRLLGYLWPDDAPELRVRVVLAMVCLVVAKVAVVVVPVFYKHAVDALSGDSVSGVIALPVGIVLSYGAARVLSLAFGELRDAIFARVGNVRSGASRWRCSGICMRCHCAFMSIARRVVCRARSAVV